jgi:TolB-like protein/class 3 adenylate cyclase/Flp pilus assembly protein TadD
MQRRLTTILAADVAGYSRLAAADEEGTVTRLRALRQELIDPVVAANGGRLVKTTGDGRLIEFGSVVDAVRCAIEAQRKIALRNADVAPDRRIEFRVGIHLGDVIVESDGDLMGDGVNIAARLEGIAEPGGICLSDDAYRQVRDKIAAEFADLGEQSLKNIARPVRVYAVGPQKSPSPPQWGGEGRDGVGKSSDKPTSPSHAFGAGPSLSPRERAERGNPPRLSIVVLPFANIGGDPEQEYFVDGVTESLTTDLSRISGSFVIARNTAFTYKGKSIDVKQIGRELGVRYVLEGSVQRGGNRLRVNVQLIDAATGNHLWAERFDKPVADLFDMQDEIVARLANQLGAQLIAAEARRAENSPQPDSMDLYFQGMAWMNKGMTPEYLAQARGFFERALALDPGNVEALVGIAQVDASAAGNILTGEGAARLAAAEIALTKALSLVPDHAAAHLYLGYVQIYTNRATQGIAEFERALALDRNLARAHGWIGLAKYFIGRTEETEGHILEALRLSPRDQQIYYWMDVAGGAKLVLGRDEEAVARLRQSIEANRNFPLAHFFLAAALAHLDRTAEARAAVQAGLALDPAFTVSRFRAGAGTDNPVFLAQRERFYDGMRKAGVPEG